MNNKSDMTLIWEEVAEEYIRLAQEPDSSYVKGQKDAYSQVGVIIQNILEEKRTIRGGL